jgi:hypothetical protein
MELAHGRGVERDLAADARRGAQEAGALHLVEHQQVPRAGSREEEGLAALLGLALEHGPGEGHDGLAVQHTEAEGDQSGAGAVATDAVGLVGLHEPTPPEGRNEPVRGGLRQTESSTDVRDPTRCALGVEVEEHVESLLDRPEGFQGHASFSARSVRPARPTRFRCSE